MERAEEAEQGVPRGGEAEWRRFSAPCQATEAFEGLEGGGAGLAGGRSHGKEVADVEEDLEHELVAHVCVLQFGHADGLAVRGGAVVGIPVDGFEILKDSFASAHGGRPWQG